MDLITEYFEYEKREKIRRYQILNAYAKKGQTVLAGSSLMEQFPIYEFLQTHPIPRTVYNRGVSGFTTTELLETLDICVLELEPSRVFINIGTNDINGEDYREDGLIDRYRTILEAIRARLPHVVIYTMAYYPVNELDDFGSPQAKEWLKTRTNRRIDSANARVEALTGQLGCHYINLNAGLLDDRQQLKKEYSVEGVHMYGSGYHVVFDALLPYLLEA